MEKEYTQEYMNSIDEAMENPEFLQLLSEVSSKEEIISAFAKKDIDIDMDVAQQVYMKIKNISESGELDEETLDAVNGGVGPLFWGVVIGVAVVVAFIVYKIGCWILGL